jgi:hypothetical protein
MSNSDEFGNEVPVADAASSNARPPIRPQRHQRAEDVGGFVALASPRHVAGGVGGHRPRCDDKIILRPGYTRYSAALRDTD